MVINMPFRRISLEAMVIRSQTISKSRSSSCIKQSFVEDIHALGTIIRDFCNLLSCKHCLRSAQVLFCVCSGRPNMRFFESVMSMKITNSPSHLGSCPTEIFPIGSKESADGIYPVNTAKKTLQEQFRLEGVEASS